MSGNFADAFLPDDGSDPFANHPVPPRKARATEWFTQVSDRVFALLPELSGNAVKLVLAILRRSRLRRGNPEVLVTNKLAQEVGLSRWEKYAAMKQLEQVGFLRVVEADAARSPLIHTSYIILKEGVRDKRKREKSIER